MKKRLIIFAAVLGLAVGLTGCTKQTMTREFGGSMTIDLDKGQKLEEITWKDEDSLWILTKPMTDDDIAETHTFKESSAYGLIEGEITIIEHK